MESTSDQKLVANSNIAYGGCTVYVYVCLYVYVQLHISAANGYVQVAEYLLAHHVSVDSPDNDTWQPIHCAACWGQVGSLDIELNPVTDPN